MRLGVFTSKRLAIDLGTSNSLVWASQEGIIISEPSVVAVDFETGKVAAVGSQAYELLGRTGADLVAQKPLKEGVVADFFVCQAMISYFIDKALGFSRFSKPEVMVCIPYGITQVERRAVLEATVSAGAKRAYLIDQPLAAAIGAKLPLDAPAGSMIVDIGGGQVGAAVVSMGGIVVAGGTRAGGEKIDDAIITYMRRIHNQIIGARMAEEIKIAVGSASVISPKKTFDVKGRDAITGLPKTVSVNSDEITQAILPVLHEIVSAVKSVLEQTPPELASDIIDRGIVVSGGTALLRNIDRFISNQIGVSAHIAEEPMQAAVLGTGLALENIDNWRKAVLGSRII